MESSILRGAAAVVKAWYFSYPNCRLRYGDDREIKAGVIHKVDCKPVLCESGLHGSVNILDALKYAPGPYIWRVNLRGEIIKGDDKAVATEREYLWGYDATDVLRYFARLCALDVVHLWAAPEVVIQYLKTGDEKLRAAAWAAACAAACAACAATRAAACAAAEAACAACAAAEAARAARAALRDSQSKRLYHMIMAGRP